MTFTSKLWSWGSNLDSQNPDWKHMYRRNDILAGPRMSSADWQTTEGREFQTDGMASAERIEMCSCA